MGRNGIQTMYLKLFGVKSAFEKVEIIYFIGYFYILVSSTCRYETFSKTK